MEGVYNVLQKYSTEISVEQVVENFEKYSLSYTLENINNKFDKTDIDNILYLANERDDTILNIKIDDGDPFSFKLNFEEQPWTIDNINQLIEEDSIIAIDFTINKRKKDNIISVYDLDAFCCFLESLDLLHLLNYLQKYLDINTMNIFEVQDGLVNHIYFQSSIISFSSSTLYTSERNIPTTDIRNNYLKTRTLNTNSQRFSKYNFIPSDFNNLINSLTDDKLLTIFNKLKIVLAASFISNYSDITNKNIQLGFIGHSYLEVNSNFRELNVTEAQTFYSIFEWIFSSGEPHDKLDLARNIISRYFIVRESKWELSHDTLGSILSAHAIYLKDNVEKYIETKNKVAEVTKELSVKSKDVIQYFSSNFKNNNLTLITYFISIFIFNSLSNNNDKQIFTEEKYYISLVFLFISACFLWITLVQVKKDIRVNIRYFYSLKKIYSDLFDKKELNKLFHKRHLNYNIQNLKRTVCIYSMLWMLEIISLLTITILFTFYL